MYCPECHAEYDDDFTECSQCRVPLMRGSGPDSGEQLVSVLETNDRIQLAMARGLLEDAGIPFILQGQIATLVQDVDGFLRKWVRVQVPRDREIEARDVLDQLMQPVPQDSADAGA
ncbi:MAG TPA: DUF2007 domain-containing protein [Verrucomicrobiae bacterium]|nr:DUF2007 domain-containing protein [Candidatus Acidoferrales bacterium]HXK04251.1 DUF2007 domain-containing protein [Verrucomicrobiae bacterium]